MTTDPKPTPLEDLAIIWRWVEKNDLDEIRYLRLRAALERLEGYERHPGIIPPVAPMEGGFSLDKFMPGLTPEDAAAMGDALDAMDAEQPSGNPGELDALRAEVAALKVEREVGEIAIAKYMDQLAALKVKLQDAERIGAINRSHLEQSAARSTALAARVEALEDELRDHGPPPYSVGRACDQWSHTAVSILSSTPAADLAAKQKAEAERDDRIRRETCDKIIAEWKRIDDETPQLVYHAAGLTAPGAGEGE